MPLIGEGEESAAGLHVYHCNGCSAYAFILDCDLSTRPNRKTDGSFVVNEAKHLKKIKMQQGDVKRIKRCVGPTCTASCYDDEQLCSPLRG